LKMILGMLWAIILDYQIKGISVEELTAKEGLLLWCQKKTAGYRDVKIDNFSTSWITGLGFCALIHRHRPDLINFDSLNKADAEKNLELAFDVAEKLGIPKLLDVSDLLNVARPDERSVMTYVSEYFLCFASMDVKESAARRVQKFVAFIRSIQEMQNDYETQASQFLSWIESTVDRMNDRSFGDSLEDATRQFAAHKEYLTSEKPAKVGLKLDLEALYANIQTKLAVYGIIAYEVPEGLSTEQIEQSWDKLEQAEKLRGTAVRQNRFKFITKSSSSISEEQTREFEASFVHFDKDGNGSLDKAEFKAALSTLSIPFKNEEAYLKVFNGVSEGAERISRAQFFRYMHEIHEDKDSPEQLKQSFQTLSDQSDTISEQQLRVRPLDTPEIDYLQANMPAVRDGAYDYVSFTNSKFK